MTLQITNSSENKENLKNAISTLRTAAACPTPTHECDYCKRDLKIVRALLAKELKQ